MQNSTHGSEAGWARMIGKPAAVAIGLIVVTACVTSPRSREASVHLGDYEPALRLRRIDGIEDNASGLTYSARGDSLFLITNRPPAIVELSLHGQVKRRIELNGFEDTEGIAWIEEETFAVVEERRGTIAVIVIEQTTEAIDYESAVVINVADSSAGNAGLEGLAYDRHGERFFAVKESAPKRGYEIGWNRGAEHAAEVGLCEDMAAAVDGLLDLSGVYFDHRTGNLLILSDESSRVVELGEKGEATSQLDLSTDLPGLRPSPTQVEGITMDERRNIYICGEPSEFYVFSPREP